MRKLELILIGLWCWSAALFGYTLIFTALYLVYQLIVESL